MNLLIAPDSFKGTLSASQIIDIITNKLRKLKIPAKLIKNPLADGGEGSLEVIDQSSDFENIKIKVFNPFFKKINAYYLYNKENRTAYIEMAKASGLILINKPDVMNATTFGTGQLIKHAIENGAEKIILFIGGSATNDAGIGIANALGIKFFNKSGKELKPIGKNLTDIHIIDDSKSIVKKYKTEILIAADVNNPFYGKNGASYIYAKQKGANPKEIIHLDKGLQNIAAIFNKQYYINVQK